MRVAKDFITAGNKILNQLKDLRANYTCEKEREFVNWAANSVETATRAAREALSDLDQEVNDTSSVSYCTDSLIIAQYWSVLTCQHMPCQLLHCQQVFFWSVLLQTSFPCNKMAATKCKIPQENNKVDCVCS
jgi:hypothetical protein